MAHVQIRSFEEGPFAALQVIVDGVDLSDHVFTEGFGLVRVGDDLDGAWGVSMILAADSLDIDLPDAVVQAVARSDEEVSAEVRCHTCVSTIDYDRLTAALGRAKR